MPNKDRKTFSISVNCDQKMKKPKTKKAGVMISAKPNIEVEPCEKIPNILGNLTHKKSFGANNWNTYIHLQSKNSSEIKAEKNEGNKVRLNSKTECKIKKINFETNSKRGTSRPRLSSSNTLGITDDKYPHNIKESTKGVKGLGLNDKMTNQPGIALKDPLSQSIYSKRVVQHSNKLRDEKTRSQVNKNVDENAVTKEIAIDCEMVGVEVGVKKDMLARVSLVNFHGNCIYDTFVKPVEPVVDYRTRVSGVRAENLENAPDFSTVQQKVAGIIKTRILVGHALKKDLAVLFLTHPRFLIRDTSKFQKFRRGKTPALRKLAKEYLGVTIQKGEHSSVQDALAAMQLYKMFKKEWEESIRTKRKRHVKEKQKDAGLPANAIPSISAMDV